MTFERRIWITPRTYLSIYGSNRLPALHFRMTSERYKRGAMEEKEEKIYGTK